MHVRLTKAMLDALKDTREIPDVLKARLERATRDGDAYLVTLSDDEAMAMTEMCQWYIVADPDTGEMTETAKLYDAIVEAIDEAG